MKTKLNAFVNENMSEVSRIYRTQLGRGDDVRLYLFCLMANHFHLMLETPGGNLSRFMQKLTTSYSVYFNLRHGLHGHLFDGRFKAKVVSEELGASGEEFRKKAA